MTAGQQLEAGAYFDAQTSPALTPLVIDPVHPFPFLSSLSTSLIFLLHDAERAERPIPALREMLRTRFDLFPAGAVVCWSQAQCMLGGDGL